jgi:hypothetical protein
MSKSPSDQLHRPGIVTVVGIVTIIAGVFPALEIVAILANERFRAWFLSLIQSVVPISLGGLLVLLLVVSAADIVLGIAVLTRRRWATPGMIFRSILAVGIDYVNFHAGNHAGAAFGFAVNVLLVLALLLPRSRAWFRCAA